MRLERITKSFGTRSTRVRAVDDVTLDIHEGEILAVVGQNGAGKTTLMRIAAGELEPDSGAVIPSEIRGIHHRDTETQRGTEGTRRERVAESEVQRSPQSGDPSTSLGMTGTSLGTTGAATTVGFVHQHFLLVSELTIAENLALIDPRFRFATRRTLVREAEAIVRASGIDLRDVTRRVAGLSVGEKAKVELIKAVARRPATLILDEPTAVLTPLESEELFAVMRTLAERGTAIVFISHKLPEVLAVAQRVAVMNAGTLVLDTRNASAETIAGAMTEIRETAAGAADRESAAGPVALQHDALTLHENEIVAIVGVAGNGQTELAAQLRDRLPSAAHIPEDRTRDGVIAELTIAENLALRHVANAAGMIESYSIKARGPQQRAGDLSGGNQQKVLLARELGRQPQVIIAAEPTRGLDLDATRFVHERLRQSAVSGAAILLITSDLDEAFALADVIHVIYRGRLSSRMSRDEASGRVANLMAGVA